MDQLYRLEHQMALEANEIRKLVDNQEAKDLIDIWIADEHRHAELVQELRKMVD